MAQHGRIDDKSEFVNRAEAEAWWPYPLLVSDQPLPDGTEPVEVFIAKADGGRRTDPRNSAASISAVYQVPDQMLDSGGWKWLDSGGILVGITTTSPSAPASIRGKMPDGGDRVRVRGREAVLETYATDGGDENMRMIWWLEPQDDGAELRFQIVASLQRYTLEQTVAWIDALVARP